MSTISGLVRRCEKERALEECLESEGGANILVATGQFDGLEDVDATIALLKSKGVLAVIAGGFARSIYRRAINNGIAMIALDLADQAKDGQTVSIDLAGGKIAFDNQEVSFPAYPELLQQVMKSGNLIEAVKKELGRGE